jgi:hypothetical protein
MADQQFLAWAQVLQACFEEALSNNPNPPPGGVCLTWGDPVADFGVDGSECCDGVAYVSMMEFYPSSNLFPDRTIERQSGPCGIVAWALRLRMTIFRCWPAGDLRAPTCEEKEAAAIQLFHDGQAMRQAICCFRAAAKARDFLVAVTDSTPIDPGGGCAGLESSLAIQLPNCDEC